LKTKTKTEGPVVKKNRFPLATSHPDTDVLYQGITHTLYIKKKSKNPLKQREISTNYKKVNDLR